MKKIFYIFAITLILTSCANVNNLPKVDTTTGYKIVYWSGNDVLVEINDTTDGSKFEPVILRHASKRQLKKLYPDQNDEVSKAIFFNE